MCVHVRLSSRGKLAGASGDMAFRILHPLRRLSSLAFASRPSDFSRRARFDQCFSSRIAQNATRPTNKSSTGRRSTQMFDPVGSDRIFFCQAKIPRTNWASQRIHQRRRLLHARLGHQTLRPDVTLAEKRSLSQTSAIQDIL